MWFCQISQKHSWRRSDCLCLYWPPTSCHRKLWLKQTQVFSPHRLFVFIARLLFWYCHISGQSSHHMVYLTLQICAERMYLYPQREAMRSSIYPFLIKVVKRAFFLQTALSILIINVLVLVSMQILFSILFVAQQSNFNIISSFIFVLNRVALIQVSLI